MSGLGSDIYRSELIKINTLIDSIINQTPHHFRKLYHDGEYHKFNHDARVIIVSNMPPPALLKDKVNVLYVTRTVTPVKTKSNQVVED